MPLISKFIGFFHTTHWRSAGGVISYLHTSKTRWASYGSKNRRNRGGDGVLFEKDVKTQCRAPEACTRKSKPGSPLGVQNAFQATPDIWPSWGCLEAVAGVCLKHEWKAEVDRFHAVGTTYHIFCLARTALDMLSKQLAEMCERFQHLSVALPLSRRPRTFDLRHAREEHQNCRCGACVDPPVPRNQFKTSVSHIGIEVFVHLEDTWFQIRLMNPSMLVL